MRRLSLILSVAGLAALSTACISVKSETGDTWETEETSVRHLKNIWKTSGRHLTDIWRPEADLT